VADSEFNWDTAAEHCRTAFLRGAFLARGSLSITPTGTHLELIVDAADVDEFAHRVADIGLPAGARMRREKGVLTWKSSDLVTELLRRIGASAGTLELGVTAPPPGIDRPSLTAYRPASWPALRAAAASRRGSITSSRYPRAAAT